jgi:RsmE family RNA methyltransferase
VNLILFEPAELGAALPLADPRAVHLLKILHRRVGDGFDAGVVGGSRGRGTLVSIGPGALRWTFAATVAPPPADALHLLLALPRPQTARKLLQEAAALGVASLRFFPAEKGEPSYAASTLWKSGEWRRHLVDGAAQAFDTLIPELRHEATLASALGALPAGAARVALDNYEATSRLAAAGRRRPLVLAFGAERGWSAAERTQLRGAGFALAHLGPRVLRVETAVVAAVALAQAAG